MRARVWCERTHTHAHIRYARSANQRACDTHMRTHAHAHTAYTILYPLIIRHQHGWQPAIKHAQLIFKSYQRYLMLLHTITPAKCRVRVCVFTIPHVDFRAHAAKLRQFGRKDRRQRHGNEAPPGDSGSTSRHSGGTLSLRSASGCFDWRPTCAMWRSTQSPELLFFVLFRAICVLNAEPKIIPIECADTRKYHTNQLKYYITRSHARHSGVLCRRSDQRQCGVCTNISAGSCGLHILTVMLRDVIFELYSLAYWYACAGV